MSNDTVGRSVRRVHPYRKVVAGIVGCATLLVGPAAAIATVVGDPDSSELCPPATERRSVVTIDGLEVRAPASDSETRAAREQLSSIERDARIRAAVALAMAGDVPAFQRLLEARDVAMLSSFGRFYIPPEGDRCVDEVIERAVLEHVDDPQLRPALMSLFEQNLYRSRALFDALIEIEFDDGRPQDFSRIVMALLATRLDGIEDEVLNQAERHLLHDTPVRKRVLPGVHRRWVAFFNDRGYLPAVDYLERLLLAEGWDETIDSFVAEYSQTRSTVYRTLDGFEAPEVADVLIRQLSRVVAECPPELVEYELSAFGRFAVGHAASEAQRERVGELLTELLESGVPAAPTGAVNGIDFQLHKLVVELLTALGTTKAADALIADLDRLTGLDDRPSAEALIVTTLEGLRKLPDAAELDVPALLAAAADLPATYRLHTLPMVLETRRDPAAHAFFLEQLRWIADNRDALGSSFAADADRAQSQAIERLMAFEAADQLAMTRDTIDALYREGGLDEAEYVATSSRLNQLLGDESTTFLELQESRERARHAAVETQREEHAAKWHEEVVRNTSPEGILTNLESLASGRAEASTAASWLVIAGSDTLPLAHRMIADQETPDEARLRLLQVLGEIGDRRSIPVVIELTRARAGNRAYLGAGLRALALMPLTSETFSFAQELLGEGSTLQMRQQALVYLAEVRDHRAEELASAYSDPDVEPDVRVAGLLLAARLGQGEVRPLVLESLRTSEDRSHIEVLLRAIAELSDTESLEAAVDDQPALRDTASFRQASRLTDFRCAVGEPKVEAARVLVGRGNPWDRREAVRFLVDEGHEEELLNMLQMDPGLGLPLLQAVIASPRGVSILAQIRRMGYRVEETTEGLALVLNE